MAYSFPGGLSVDTFLRDYWQKQPLLVRNAFPGIHSPLTPNELAGLACAPDVESRLVMERGGAHPWQVRHGPFDARDFAALPESHWTLLVQEVNRLVPAAASRGFKTMSATYLADNAGARGLLESCGFVLVADEGDGVVDVSLDLVAAAAGPGSS